MKKKILVEDIERMVREEVSKRLNESPEYFRGTDKALALARRVLYAGFAYDDPTPGSGVAKRLMQAGIDPKIYGRLISRLVDGKWKKDIEAAALQSRNENYKAPDDMTFDQLMDPDSMRYDVRSKK